MEKWFVTAKSGEFDKWAQEFHISPVLARILRNRELKEELTMRKFLFGTLEDCHSPWLLKDLDKAVQGILDAVEQGLTIRVIGDYDVDGICSAYILTKGLEVLGAKVDTMIPHRIHDGYGLNEHLIEEAYRDGIGLIVTCDNGIAAAPQIQLAVDLGMQVIVTDHHEVPFEEGVGAEGESVRRELLPPALAVVDPKRQECTYPYKNICGGVVAYKLMQALAERSGSEALQREMDALLEFAALATVCDVMELLDENHIIVKEGLQRMRYSKNLGLQALMEVNRLDTDKLSAYHLGFVIGPCLNATGRLDTAKRALELLQSKTRVEAVTAARELKELNDSRKNLTLQGVADAEKYIEEQGIIGDSVYLIYLPDVHESLAGIIAGRVREKYNHPVFVLTKGEEGVKGSGRSIDSYHMYEAMVRNKAYFTKFGGHKLAAGLSMEEDKIEPLRQALNGECGLGEEDFYAKVVIDVPMPIAYANEALANQQELLEPFGVGNPKPLFAEKNVHFHRVAVFGKNKNVMRCTVSTGTDSGSGANYAGNGTRYQMIYFGDIANFEMFVTEKYGADAMQKLRDGNGDVVLSVAYQIGMNSYNGRKELQLIMQNYC